jgi:hypothetical protein
VAYYDAFALWGAADIHVNRSLRLRGLSVFKALLNAGDFIPLQPSKQSSPSNPAPAIPANPEIDLVKNGVLPEYNSTTIGKAFEGTFQDAQWKSFVSPKGATLVEFDGTTTMKALRDGGIKIAEGNEIVNPLIKTCMATVGLREQMTQEAHNPTDGRTYIGPDISGASYDGLPVLYWMLRLESAHPDWYEKLNACINIPVSFQFATSVDKKTFTLAYFDQPMFGGQENKALAFIYH